MSVFSSTDLVRVALLALAVFIAYAPAIDGGYVWDDFDYVVDNELIRDLDGLAQAWVPGNTVQYYPAVFTTFWLEYQLWELEPMGYHVVNVLLHILNAVLIWRVAAVLAIPGAFYIAAVFALHPVHVESVAWITERKNVLSGAFYFLSILTYLRFDEARARGDAGVWPRFTLSLALYVVAMLAKTAVCSLPAALVLMLLWKRETVGPRRLLPLLPFFVVGIGMSLITIVVEHGEVGARGPEFEFSLLEKLQISSHSLLFYAQKLVVPYPVIFYYPRWTLDAGDLVDWIASLALLVIGSLSIRAYLRGCRGPALALAYFAGTIFPTLGFLALYFMRYSFVADHFQYLASLGLTALFVAAANRYLSKKLDLRILGGALLLVLAVLTNIQCRDYESEETLWRSTIEKNPKAWAAYNNLGDVLSESGRVEEALETIEEGVKVVPEGPARDQMEQNVAILLMKLKRFEEAGVLLEVLQARRGGQELRLGNVAQVLGRLEDAERYFRAALPDERQRVPALVRLGINLKQRGRADEACPFLAEYIESEPDDLGARMQYAEALASAGRRAEAMQVARSAHAQALKIGQPDFARSIESWRPGR